jgi:hypothetical protein
MTEDLDHQTHLDHLDFFGGPSGKPYAARVSGDLDHQTTYFLNLIRKKHRKSKMQKTRCCKSSATSKRRFWWSKSIWWSKWRWSQPDKLAEKRKEAQRQQTKTAVFQLPPLGEVGRLKIEPTELQF